MVQLFSPGKMAIRLKVTDSRTLGTDVAFRIECAPQAMFGSEVSHSHFACSARSIEAEYATTTEAAET